MIGRVGERQELEASLSASEAQLIAVCGRLVWRQREAIS